MENKNQKRNSNPQKIRAAKFNGRFSFIGVTGLVEAYISTDQIIRGIF